MNGNDRLDMETGPAEVAEPTCGADRPVGGPDDAEGSPKAPPRSTQRCPHCGREDEMPYLGTRPDGSVAHKLVEHDCPRSPAYRRVRQGDTPFAVPCPDCGAAPGRSCRDAGWVPRERPHERRVAGALDGSLPRGDGAPRLGEVAWLPGDTYAADVNVPAGSWEYRLALPGYSPDYVGTDASYAWRSYEGLVQTGLPAELSRRWVGPVEVLSRGADRVDARLVDRRREALDVGCPGCGAEPGARCGSMGGGERMDREPHGARVGAAMATGDCGWWDGPADHVYGVCNRRSGHPGRHVETRDGKLWAEWGGGNPGPLPEGAVRGEDAVHD